ncbi:MAG: arylsulfatase [Opitutales bacterium]
MQKGSFFHGNTYEYQLSLALHRAARKFQAPTAGAPLGRIFVDPRLERDLAQCVPSRPNIVVILVDDMGFSDIGAYGSEIDTPNLDRLAGNGLRFSQFYNCARCCPTRAALLTGLYPHQAGVGHMTGIYGDHPSYQGCLNDRCVTIPEVLRHAGYRTYMAGKWHVGGDYRVNEPESWAQVAGDAQHPIPVQRGFDEHYGTLCGAGSFFEPPTLVHNDRFIPMSALPDDYYYTDAIGEESARMVASGDTDKPFFLYMAHTAPHWPLHAPEATTAQYLGRYRGGWDQLREARYESILAAGLLDSKWPLSPRDPRATPWADEPLVDWQDRRMAVYAAQIEHMDRAVGRLLTQLETLGQLDNTLIFFMSDNGGCAEFLQEDPAPNAHPGQYVLPLRDGRQTRVGNFKGQDPGGADTFMSYDLSWSNASNTPFRKHKHWIHEGGISTPLIVHWPERIQQSGIHHAQGHVIDIMATCLDAAGVRYPSTFADRAITPIEGESLLPVLDGKPWARQQPLFFEHQGCAGLRVGDWKLVREAAGGGDREHWYGQWELYNMADDRTELNDLARSDTGKRDQLLRQWGERCHLLGVEPDFFSLTRG